MVTWGDGADCTPPAPADARSSFARATGLSRPTAMILRTSADIWSRQFLAERADLPKNRGVSILLILPSSCLGACQQEAPCRPPRPHGGPYSPACRLAITGPPPCGP